MNNQGCRLGAELSVQPYFPMQVEPVSHAAFFGSRRRLHSSLSGSKPISPQLWEQTVPPISQTPPTPDIHPSYGTIQLRNERSDGHGYHSNSQKMNDQSTHQLCCGMNWECAEAVELQIKGRKSIQRLVPQESSSSAKPSTQCTETGIRKLPFVNTGPILLWWKMDEREFLF